MENDPFTKGLKDRLPNDLKDSFSSEQLAALKVAFGARRWGQHSIDLRGTIKFWNWRYYFVILMGRNRRDLSRTELEISRFAAAFGVTLFLIASTCLGILVLYLIKSALGIDLFPNHSFGVWKWFTS